MEERSASMDEYEKLLVRMSKPRVTIDNAGCADATRVMIDSARKHIFLLEVVQVLADLNLSIKKAYISSDGRWFMDVFHVTDLNGNKITDQSVLRTIEQSLEAAHGGGSKPKTLEGVTVLELTGTDRVGLLSELFAVISNLNCSVVDATVWTHNGRMASLIYLKDDDSGTPIEDSSKLGLLKVMLRNVLKGQNDISCAKTCVYSAVATHMERRLHQMMFVDRDYERKPIIETGSVCPAVFVQNFLERDYSVVNVHCSDRNKLLFDVVCTLTDMNYVVFHAIIDTSGERAFLELFIKRIDGNSIVSEVEKQRLMSCLQAAIERRASHGVRLELCTSDKKGLLAEVTRTFRENGLNVTMAEISTSKNTALDTFYVTDAVGNLPDPTTIESGLSSLKVNHPPTIYHQNAPEKPSLSPGGAMLLSLGSLVRRNLYNLGIIKSCS